MKQEPSESKIEARSNLNKALEASAAEKDKESEDQSDEEKLEGDAYMFEESDQSKSKIKSEYEIRKNESDIEAVPSKQSFKQIKTLQPASYIMKLFDRSVNLALFQEDTPLYPLCRAWMKNQPRTIIVKDEKTVDPIIQTAEDGDVVEMPRVRVRKSKTTLPKFENKINKMEFDKCIDSNVYTKEKLLEFHRNRWHDERSKQIKISRNFTEKHFAANLELIESLIKYSVE
jgi:LIN37